MKLSMASVLHSNNQGTSFFPAINKLPFFKFHIFNEETLIPTVRPIMNGKQAVEPYDNDLSFVPGQETIQAL